jgi:surface protein
MLKKMHILLLFSLLFAFSAQAQNGGASFDGVDDVITFGTPEAIQIPTEDFSFALRFKALSDPNGVYDYLFRMKDGISGVMMYLNPSNQLRTSVRGDAREQILNAGDVVTNGLYDGKVHSVVLTGDRDGSATVYIDGVDAGSLDISGIGTMGSNAYLNLGFGTLTAHMVMRDFVLYKDKVLTSAEISDYHNGVITTSNMVLHVPLNETSGLTAADASGNGNDGTVTGVTGAEEEAAFWALNHRPFVITVTTTEANESFTFYGLGGPYDIDWDGNGTFDATGVRDNQTHTYATAGTHTIRVSGLKQLYINNQADKDKYTTIEQWGTGAWTNLDNAFFGASKLTSNATDIPDFSNVTSMRVMFHSASSFTGGDIGGWDVSNVTDMGYMFYNASSFTGGDLKDWNVSNVTDMARMFSNASSFTGGDLSKWDVSNVTSMAHVFSNASSFTGGDIGGWDVSNVTDMAYMFYNASSFTGGDISGWNVSNVTNMAHMFRAASSFTGGDLKDWDVSNVTNMVYMFYNASSFTGGDISGWNVSNVTHMQGMFSNASSFTGGDISGWNVSNVTNMAHMFNGASSFLLANDFSIWNVSNVTDMGAMFKNTVSFNGDLSKWDVSNVKNTAAMFDSALAFNGNISGWAVESVQNMAGMFRDNPVFNQDLSSWKTDSVKTMYQMFHNAAAFNQDVSGWTVANVANMDSMFTGAAAYSVENYDKILDVTNGWLKNDVQDSVVFGAPAQYTIAGQPGRDKLVNDYGWTITGDTRINVGPAFTGNFPDITFAEDDSAEVLFKTIMAIVSDPDTEPDSLDIYPIGLTNIIEGAATDSSAFFKAPANWFGKDTLQLVVSDGALNDTSDTFVVEVTAVNDAPVISGLQETLTFKAGTPAYLSLAAYASDVDNDASSLAWSFESSEDSVTAVYDSGKDTLTIEAHGAYNGGNVDLTCTVSDGELTAAAVIKLTVDPAGSLKELPDGVPTVYALHQNYPNPFNPSTTIVYSLPKAGDVKITLYNIMGQRVGVILNGYKAAGHHEVKFDASHLASGNYFYLLESKDFRKIRKMLLLK